MKGMRYYLSSYHPTIPSPFAFPHRGETKTNSSSYVPRVRAFWSKVQIGDGCWIWNASTTKSGYGQFWDGSTMVRAHRFAYELTRGPVPAGEEIGHLCHQRICVRPDHLRAMTHAENMAQRFEREGAPSATLGRAMTSTERSRRAHARKKAKAHRELAESGWWVQI